MARPLHALPLLLLLGPLLAPAAGGAQSVPGTGFRVADGVPSMASHNPACNRSTQRIDTSAPDPFGGSTARWENRPHELDIHALVARYGRCAALPVIGEPRFPWGPAETEFVVNWLLGELCRAAREGRSNLLPAMYHAATGGGDWHAVAWSCSAIPVEWYDGWWWANGLTVLRREYERLEPPPPPPPSPPSAPPPPPPPPPPAPGGVLEILGGIVCPPASRATLCWVVGYRPALPSSARMDLRLVAEPLPLDVADPP